MGDLATLYIKVTPEGVVTTSTELKGLTETTKKTEKATDALTASFTKMVQGAVTAYRQAADASKVSATEQIKTQAKINDENARYQLARLAYLRRILNEEVTATKIAEKEKQALQKHANDENAKYWLAKQSFDRKMLNAETAAYIENEKRKVAAQKATLQEAEKPWKTLGIQSQAYYTQQKDAAITAYNTIAKSASSTAEDRVRAERAMNEKIKTLNKEMVGSHEMSMAAMMRAVLRLYAAYYVLRTAIEAVLVPFKKGFLAVDTYNQSVASLAAMVVTFTERQKGMDLAGQWQEALRYSTQMVPILETIAAKTLLSGQETTALANAFARQGVFLQANNEKQLEAFTRLSNALPLMTQGQEIMRQINTEVRSLMTGSNAASSMLLQTLEAIDPEIKKHLVTWREEGKVMEHIGDMLQGFGPATSLLEIQWQAVKSTIDTTVTQILRGGMTDAYKDIISLVQELNGYLLEHKDEIIKGIAQGWDSVKDAVKESKEPLLAIYNIMSDLKTLYDTLPSEVTGAVGIGLLGRILFGAAGGWVAIALYSINELMSATGNGIADLAKKYNDADAAIKKFWKSLLNNNNGKTLTVSVYKAEVDKIREALKEESFDFKPIPGPDAEAENAAKKAARVKEAAMAQILEATRKNAYELEAVGQTQYEKDMLRIGQEAQKYSIAGVDKISIAKYVEGEISIAQAKEADRRKKEAEKATEDYKKLMDNEATFSVDRYTEGSNRIIAEAQRKVEELRRIESEGGPAAEPAIQLVNENAAAMQDELNMQMLEEQASYYEELYGMDEKYYDMRRELIEKERKFELKYHKENLNAEKDAAQKRIKLETEIAKTKLNNIAEGMGALSQSFEQMSQLYAEDSKERERLHNIATAFNVAQNVALTAIAIKEAVAAIANQGQGDPYTAFARVAAMTALMAATLASTGISFGGGGSSSVASKPASTVLGAEAGTASESLQNSWELLKDTYDMEYRELTSIYNELRNLNSNISGLVARVLKLSVNSLGLTDSYKIGGLGVGMDRFFSFMDKIFATSAFSKVSNAVFGGGVKKKVTEQGLKISDISIEELLAGSPLMAYQYATIKKTKEGGWFHSDRVSYTTKLKALDETTTKMLGDIMGGISSTLVSLSESLGTDVQAALDYSFGEITLNLKKKKTADEISEAITGMFSNMADTAAETLFGDLISKYQQVGEGLYETAIRLVTDKAVMLDVLDKTGQAFIATSEVMTKSRMTVSDEWLAWDSLSKKKKKKVEEPVQYVTEYYQVLVTAAEKTLDLSEALITLAGSLEDLQDISSSYYDKFFSDEEKHLRLQEQLQGAMEDINQTLPDTRAGYRAIVESLDLTTEAGQLAYITMLQLAEYADQYYSTLEDTLQEATDAQNEYIDSLKELIITIDEWLANLNLSDLSPVGSEAAWRQQYATSLAAATQPSASADTVNDFLNYATKFLTYEKTYGTDASYQAIYDAVVADVMAIRALTTATIGSYATGTNYVPKTGPYTLHEGEIVIDRKNSDAIRAGNFDAEALGKSIAKYLGNTSGGDIKVSIQIDGREIGNVVAKQTRTNTDLQTSIRRLAA